MSRDLLPQRHGIYDAPGPENVRSTIGWTALAVLIGYAALDAIFPNNDVNIIVSIVTGLMALMVLFYYLPQAAYAIWVGSSDRQDYLIVGIVLGWIATDGQMWLTAIARLAGLPPSFVNSELFGFAKTPYILAAVLHVIPKGAANGSIPRGNKSIAAACFVVSLALAILVVTVRPDPRPLIDMMPAWSRDLFKTGHVGADPPKIG